MRITVREAQAAHYAVAKALRHGELSREWCEVCGDEAQAHHDDYRRPLDVRWLCPKHHMQWHRTNPSDVAWDSGETQMLSFRMSAQLLESLRELAVLNERTVSQEIRLAIVKHLKATA